MKLGMYSIRDAKADIYNPPFFKRTRGEAERDFKTACRDGKTHLNKNPEDYDLWFVGNYDDNTGLTDPLKTPEHIMKAVSCIEPSNAEGHPELREV
jgi:hypothetical protein